MKTRRLNDQGRELYRVWLVDRASGELPPSGLVAGQEYTEEVFDREVDADKSFSNRFEFAEYLLGQLSGVDIKTLLSPVNDGFWDWVTVIYFKQFGRKTSKPWHYAVARKGHSGSLAYRHLARTAFEMYWRHGEESLVMLHVDMATWGDLSEQLTSRQNVAYHKGYIKAAKALYFSEGKLKRGSASRVRPPKKRKAGETIGRGGVARLALAVRRLCRTYDTHVLDTEQMLTLLPREFGHFATKAAAGASKKA